MTDRKGQRLGQYRLHEFLGRGGFAEVYLGEHIFLKTQAAIKVLHMQLAKEERDNFLNEARTLVNLEHPHIIKVFDCNVEHDTAFIVMQYAPNGSLRPRYQKRVPVPLTRILPDVKQIAEALQYAHDKKLIHRDVKPENMLVGAQQEILLSDFGLAVVVLSTLHQKRQKPFGTLPYMAPEQLYGQPCYASDQYSLGIVVYEWLCGGLPFTGTQVELIFQHENVSPPSMYQQVPSITHAVEQVVRQALMKDPRKRFASVREFAQALEEANRTERSNNVSKRSTSTSSSVERVVPVVATPPQKANYIWNVPFRRNIFLTGRECILSSIHETLHPNRTYDTLPANKMTLTHTLAISGMGGIGKTQTIVEYVYRHYDDYQAVLWIRADTRDTFTADVLDIATRLKLGGGNGQDTQRTIEAVKDWLHRHDRWLLVVDNVEDFNQLKAFLPATVQGHILLTTRTQNTSTFAQRLDLPIMRDDEGALFLLHRVSVLSLEASLEEASEADCSTAKEIVAALGGLPLALDQAGAYIGETGCSLEDYLHRYKTSRAMLLSMRGGLVTDHQDSVTETIVSALKKIEPSWSAAAIELLRFCAFLAPHAIPEEILTEGAVELGPTLQAIATDPVKLDKVIAALRKFSLVRRSPDAKVLSLHPLVQATVEDSMSEDLRYAWASRVVRAVNRVFPDVHELTTWSRCKQYTPHVLRCVGLIEQWNMNSLEAARLLEQTGIYLREYANYTQADKLFRRASDMLRQMTEQGQQGTTLPLISMTDLNISIWQRYHQGMYAQAEPFVKKTLAYLEQQSEVDTPQMAWSLFGIAKISYKQGRYDRAEALFLQALAICEKGRGLQHPSFACNLDGLGQIYLVRGQYSLAESTLQQALDIWEQQPEPPHPWMSSSLLHLAQCSLVQANYARAELYLKREQVFLEQAFGTSHPVIADSLNDWANLSMAYGRYKQAETVLQQALSILEQTVGLKHPIAGRTLNTLARLYYLQGKYTQAERLLQRALAICEVHLGVDHPEVATIMHNLAEVYAAQSNRTLAKELYQSALDLRRKKLGPDHFDVAQSLNCLARLYYGDYSCAETFHQQALAMREKVLGPSHPDVAQSLNDLANLYRNMARRTSDRHRYAQAEPLYKRALAIREQVLGPEHRDVAEILKNYAMLLFALDRKVEGTELAARAKMILARWSEQEET